MHAQLYGRVAAGDELRRDAQTGQHLQGPGLDSQGAGLVDAVDLTVDDAEPRAERPKLGGQGQPGRTGAHDEDVEGHGSVIRGDSGRLSGHA
jgi:hypothetical protein